MLVKKKKKNHHILGFNLRLGEIEAAIGIQQLKKLKKIVRDKKNLAKFLDIYLKKFKGLILPPIKKNYTHSYYVYAMRIDKNKININKKKIENFIKLKNLPIATKYQNLYKTNILKSRLFLSRIFQSKYEINRYIKKNNPSNFHNVEKLQREEFLGIGLCGFNYKTDDLKKIFNKLYEFWKKFEKN